MRPILFLLSFACTYSAWAQNDDIAVPEITVLGTGAKASTLDFVPTVSELSGTRLDRKRQSTIGETLAHETGVASSQFGPNASRPVIRGMDGDRIRVLQNGTGVLDASAASQDHAVAIDPLVVDRVEIVRGPAALLYGSSAVGGIVNMVTTRIPEKVPEKATGKAETRFSSTDMGRSAGLGVEGAVSDHWVIHFDGSARGADDYHVPGYARTAKERETPLVDENTGEPFEEKSGRVYNSFNHSTSEAAGTSYVFGDGFVGTSFSNYNSTYGTVAERAVRINLLQQRWDLAGEKRTSGFLKSIRFKNSFSHYKHDEMEGSQLGTSFKNDGDEARVDIQHQPVVGFAGIFGIQANMFRFSAKGDESFLPETNNRTYSAFLFEEKETGLFKPSFGARFDAAQVKSSTDDHFGPGQTKSFDGGSVSLGFLYQITPANAAVLNAAYTQRAPNYEELFANGNHAATGIYETGDPDLKHEQSQSAELSWRHTGENSKGTLGLFLQDFHNFISLTNTGTFDPANPDVPVFHYTAVDARFYGAEAEYRHSLPGLIPGGILEIEFKLDSVRALNRKTGNDLPRITPVRETMALLYKADRFQTDIEVQRSEQQTRTDPTDPKDTKTAAYTLVNLGAEMPIRMEAASLSVFGRINNIFDVEARNHVSVLKNIAPLPGRNFVLGLQAAF